MGVLIYTYRKIYGYYSMIHMAKDFKQKKWFFLVSPEEFGSLSTK